MRLLLDEHFSPMIARALRARGHDVVAAKERPDLIGLDDSPIFAAAASEGRAMVTVDVARRPEKSGAVMLALDQLLRELPGDRDLVVRRGGEVWLRPRS